MKKFAGDIIILHMCTKNHNPMMYGSWDTEWDTEFFVILDHFLPFYHSPPKKSKKIPRDIILLYIHLYHKWRSYDIWFLKYKCNRQKFLSFWAIFCPFTTLTTQKINILKNWKKLLEILSFYICIPWQSYDVWLLRYLAQQTDFFFSFWAIFCPPPPPPP